jgi:methylmalonyl-CoA/ethylmalonyl-CoA epimerase
MLSKPKNECLVRKTISPQPSDHPTVMKKIDHIGIAVRSMSDANALFERLLGVPHYKIETVESEQVATSFFAVGDSKIELLEATGPDSPIAKYLERKGEGIHHIAFEVEDIRAEMQRLENEGFTPLNREPKRGADNKLVAFFHPKSTSGVLIELCQSIVSPSQDLP